MKRAPDGASRRAPVALCGVWRLERKPAPMVNTMDSSHRVRAASRCLSSHRQAALISCTSVQYLPAFFLCVSHNKITRLRLGRVFMFARSSTESNFPSVARAATAVRPSLAMPSPSPSRSRSSIARCMRAIRRTCRDRRWLRPRFFDRASRSALAHENS